ncbi:hypothetical protein PINS_up020672 [Pythium insidiosum]|nr:hypothetical protein PINS_up020672 [Pythium insidiosum]
MARRMLLHVVLTAVLLLCTARSNDGAITTATVTPASLRAGAQGDVTVTIASDVTLDVGASIVVAFPTGFQLSSSASTVSVSSSTSTTLSLSSITTTTATLSIGTQAIASGDALSFVLSNVLNPGATTTDAFSVTTLDSSGSTIDSKSDIAGVTLVSSTLSTASVVPDSLDAGAFGTATVSFTSSVQLPVGSEITVTFPSDFVVASAALSSLSNVDTSSTLTLLSSTTVRVTVAGSAVAASASVSFKVNNVRNPGATTTGTFSVATTDSSGNTFESKTDIAGVTLASTTLTINSLVPDKTLAGVSVGLTLQFALAMDLPSGWRLRLTTPSSIVVLAGVRLVDTTAAIDVVGTIADQVVDFTLPSLYSSGSHTVQISSFRNPGEPFYQLMDVIVRFRDFFVVVVAD